MKRPTRHDDGTYHISGKKYKELFGSRTQVMNGTAYKTTGGLHKSALTMNKWGRIVSLSKMRSAKKEQRLKKYGYTAKKGAFGAVKMGSKYKGKSRKMRGGMGETLPAERGGLAGAELSTAYDSSSAPAAPMPNNEPVKA